MVKVNLDAVAIIFLYLYTLCANSHSAIRKDSLHFRHLLSALFLSYLHIICTVQQPTNQIVSVEKGPRRCKQRQEIIQYDSSTADAGEFCVFG